MVASLQDKVLDVRSFIPDDSMQPLAHMLQLGLRKDSAKRLRLEARLGHTCHWQGTPLKALGVLETIEKLISDTRNNWHPESFLNVAEEKMQPLLRDGGFLVSLYLCLCSTYWEYPIAPIIA